MEERHEKPFGTTIIGEDEALRISILAITDDHFEERERLLDLAAKRF